MHMILANVSLLVVFVTVVVTTFFDLGFHCLSVTCSTESQGCQNRYFDCSANECSITCDSSGDFKVCSNTTLRCRNAGDGDSSCLVNCTRDARSCQSIYVESERDVLIECSSDQSCEGANITVDSIKETLNISATISAYSAADAPISDATNGDSPRINCIGDGFSKCYLECGANNAGGAYACENVIFNCNTPDICTIDCRSSSSCRYDNILICNYGCETPYCDLESMSNYVYNNWIVTCINSPTFYPSAVPSLSPIVPTFYSPTSVPSTLPTTGVPTKSPIDHPTKSPTKIGSIPINSSNTMTIVDEISTVIPSTVPMTTPTNTNNNNNNNSATDEKSIEIDPNDNDNDNANDDSLIIILTISPVSIIVILVIIGVIYYKKNETKFLINLKNTTNSESNITTETNKNNNDNNNNGKLIAEKNKKSGFTHMVSLSNQQDTNDDTMATPNHEQRLKPSNSAWNADDNDNDDMYDNNNNNITTTEGGGDNITAPTPNNKNNNDTLNVEKQGEASSRNVIGLASTDMINKSEIEIENIVRDGSISDDNNDNDNHSSGSELFENHNTTNGDNNNDDNNMNDNMDDEIDGMGHIKSTEGLEMSPYNYSNQSDNKHKNSRVTGVTKRQRHSKKKRSSNTATNTNTRPRNETNDSQMSMTDATATTSYDQTNKIPIQSTIDEHEQWAS